MQFTYSSNFYFFKKIYSKSGKKSKWGLIPNIVLTVVFSSNRKLVFLCNIVSFLKIFPLTSTRLKRGNIFNVISISPSLHNLGSILKKNYLNVSIMNAIISSSNIIVPKKIARFRKKGQYKPSKNFPTPKL